MSALFSDKTHKALSCGNYTVKFATGIGKNSEGCRMAGRKKLRDSAGRSGTVFLRSRAPHFDRKIRKLRRNRKRRNYQRNTGAGKNFSLALFYLAGMYRYPALLVLAVFQILLFIFLTLQVYICKRQLQVRFVRRTAAAVKEVPFLCELSADYKGKLPAGCIRFYLQCGYGNQKEIKRLYGNVGKDAPGFALCFPYCGTAVIRLQKFRVYDYLFLGSVQ